ncbi:MAG: hypothetical protein WHT08_08470 [Bryobacteraceae bacterium]
MKTRGLAWLLLLTGFPAAAQDRIGEILARLERLEAENRALRKEVEELRSAMSARSGQREEPRIEERLAVQEARTAELAQTRVQTASRFPVELTGMVLFNLFANGAYGASQYPTTASQTPGRRIAGGSLRQSILGFRFYGPEVAGGGKVSGLFQADFFAGSDSSLNHLFRIRTAMLTTDWRRFSVSAGQDKPLISPREPESLAQVGVSPLTGAGNPWLWQPQVRVEHRIPAGESSGLRLQGALFQTSETRTPVPDEYAATTAPSRPGYQGRFEYWKEGAEGARIELASGFHLSSSRSGGFSIPSRIFTADWLIQPVRWLDVSGLFFSGQNIAPLGALRQGFVFDGSRPRAVKTRGGYAQLAWRPAGRISLHAFSGQQDDRNADLLPGRIGKNMAVGGNVIFRAAPNVLVSAEAANLRTQYIGSGYRKVMHYDLAVAYLF